MLRFLTRKPNDDTATYPPSVGEERVYAVGDVHGRADLLATLLARLARDDAARPRAPLRLLFLGDLIDRGAASAKVVQIAMALAESGEHHVRFIKGNHEEVFIQAARGDTQAVRFFLRIGGRETLTSYGLPGSRQDDMTGEAIGQWMLEHIPRAHVDFLDGFEDMIEIGDYLFVHAGIRPNVPLDAQDSADLRWIRREFLGHDAPLGKVVVHGHSITENVHENVNRIGIDTGAYYSGRLTAIGLEGTARWYLDTTSE